MIDDMLMAAKMADVDAEWGTHHRIRPVVERPRADAIRILARWMVARRTALAAARAACPSLRAAAPPPPRCCSNH